MTTKPINGNGGFAERYGVIIQTIMVVALFGAAFWTGILSPMTEAIKYIQKDINSDHAWTQKQDVQISKLEEHIKRIDERHENHVVPRREHDANKATLDQTIKTMQDRIQEIRRDLYQNVTVGDELKRLQSDIAELRKQLQNKEK